MDIIDGEYKNIIDVEDDDPVEIKKERMSFQSIYNLLKDVDNVIITFSEDQFDTLRKGVSNAKYQTNERDRKVGKPVDDRKIEYTLISRDDTDGTARIKVNFVMTAVTVLNIEVPDKGDTP